MAGGHRDWEETGARSDLAGAPGVGFRLVSGLVEYELGGEARLDPGPAGVRWCLRVPLPAEA